MHLDRMPSISLGIIVHVGAVYDASYHWRTDAGELRASVGFDAGGYSNAPPMRWWWRRGWLADVGRQPRLPGLRVWLACPLPLARAG
jgi:hypothetical protein